MKNIHLEPLGGGIEIFVSDSYHFSTDTILLADFSKPSGKKLCADLGTGCGTIPFLWTRENPSAKILAVEIQSEACELAQKSIEHNKLSESIRILCSDLKDLKGKTDFGCYDLVACNPPYKLGGSGITNPNASLKTARHEIECTLDDICACASGLLQFGGRFCVCQRPERLADVMESMRRFSIEPKRLRLVQQRPSKPPKLFLLEGRKGGKRGYMETLPTLFIEGINGEFSDEMLEIYGDYKSGYL
ncbi:MAG: tRNA1(Val) (adenine(37)-N6)-methyltransferase [Ruminococcus sp.]|nr:tRNA1(Val) (adenine(37)-N6)-methyltransferase [Ruminococcus sp.]